MGAYIIKRLLGLIPILLGISLMTFVLIHLVPVDPAQAYLTVSKIPPTDDAVAAARTQLGLDRPLPVQYVDWLRKALHLDFGQSYVSKKPVLAEVVHAFPATIQLTFAAVIWLVLISLPLGFLSAVFKNSWFDHGGRIASFIGASIPSFWLGFLLIYFFSVKLGIFPVMGRGSIMHVVLPSLTLALGLAGIYTRLLRNNLLENLQHQFVFYARARGLKERVVLGKHVLKNALVPVINAFGMSFGYMLAGSVIVENIFAWPGLGRLITCSIFNRDYPMIQCYVLFMAVIFVVSNLLADVVSALLDPRIRIGEK